MKQGALQPEKSQEYHTEGREGGGLPTACLRPKGLAPLAYWAGAAAASPAVTG